MPVLLSGVGITFDVTDDLAVSLGCSIETEGAFDIFVLQVAVDGLRATDHLNAGVVCSKVLCKNSSVCIGIISTDDNDSCNAVLLADFSSDCKLFVGLQFGSAGTDDIETAGVSVFVDIIVIETI